MSEPYFRKSGYAIDQYLYRDECLEPCLLPFIEKYHKEDKFEFWPDLASAFLVQDWLNSKKIPFVPKNLNQAILPKDRPIEDFGGILKAKVYENKNIDQLKKKIKKHC